MPGTVIAAPAKGEAAEGAVGGDTTAPAPVDIGELWQQAQTRMGTADYDEAIVALTRLYDAIALDPEASALRLRVQWTLHRAHVGAHGVDGDLTHLYFARDLLATYLETLPEAEVERRQEATAAQKEVLARIEEQEAAEAAEAEAQAEAARLAAEREAEAARQRAAAAEAERAAREAEAKAKAPPPESNHRTFIIIGSVGVGLGVAGLATMGGGLGLSGNAIQTFETEPDMRAQARDDVQRGNTIALAGGIAGGLLLAGGAAVLALGLKRRAEFKGSLAAGPSPLGIGWRWRF
ncbi:MAG: hypothetical protein AAF799_14335 [Myxococcota bacterium]